MQMMLKKYWTKFVASLIILIAAMGMVYYKQLTEISSKSVYETYFLLFQVLFFSSIGYLFLDWIYRMFKNYRLLQNERTEAELRLLKSKIDPHFFFNTLNNLYGLAIEKSEKTPEVILKLSEIMRYTIYEGEKDFTPLKNEISYLEEYIDIQKIRYQKNVKIEFEKDVQDEHKLVSPLLFIMLLENAFKHGVERLVEDAYIKIQLKQQAHKLVFKIINNYEPKDTEISGMGLNNLKKRLRHLYPEKHKLEIREDDNVFFATLTLTLI